MYSHQIVDLFTPSIPGAIPDRGGHHNRLLITHIIVTYGFKWSIWMVTYGEGAVRCHTGNDSVRHAYCRRVRCVVWIWKQREGVDPLMQH